MIENTIHATCRTLLAASCILLAAEGARGLPRPVALDPSYHRFIENSGAIPGDHELQASDGVIYDRFGSSAAIGGDYAIVGAWGKNDDIGSAYIFEKDVGGTWLQTPPLTVPGGTVFDRFGVSVSIGGDYAIVGANGDDDAAGSAYIFERASGGVWTQTPKLTASDGSSGNYFGGSVSISGDYAIVGAEYGGGGAGAAYLFERDAGGAWLQQPTLTVSDGTYDFGKSVSISGNYAIVGAWDYDIGGQEGAVAYIFERDASGDWLQKSKLTAMAGPNDTNSGVSVSIDGDYAIVGSKGADNTAGAAFVFERDLSGVWSEQASLAPVYGLIEDFGNSVSISGDYALVGSGSWSTERSYFFERDPGDQWIQRNVLSSLGSASAVSLSGDTALVGIHPRETALVFDNASAQRVMLHEYVWSNQAGGAFSAVANWWQSAAAPTAAPNANTYVVFADESAPIVLDQNTEIRGIGLDTASVVTLDLAGHDLTTVDDPDGHRGISVFSVQGRLRLANSQPAQSVFTVHGIDDRWSDVEVDIEQGVTLNVVQGGFLSLGGSLQITLNGGVLATSDGVYVGGPHSLVGHGEVRAPLSAAHGSIIRATGDLVVGDANAFDGFFSDGRLHTGSHIVTINDRNEAVLGSVTELGDGASDGTLVANNGLVVEFGKNIVGRGLVDTPDDPLTPLINNGAVVGDSPGAIELTGYVKGVGTLENVTVSGTLSPGFSPARVHATNLGIASDGDLLMELGGLLPASQYDQLDVSGDLHLGGTLRISLIGGFDPDTGDVFDILDFDSLGGTEFDELDLPALDGRKTWDTSDLYVGGSISVVRMLDGDTNVDWSVDLFDYDALLSEIGGQGDWRTDFNEDGRVDLEDFALMRANFGVIAGSPAGSNDMTASTPEPATLATLLLGAGALVRRRKKRA